MQVAPARAESQAGPQRITGAGLDGQLPKAEARPSADSLCRALARAAADNGLPVEFFTRLIWLESRFNPNAVSPKGAQGIAQFMPRTASGRGLTDPFEPLMALREAASYLRELRTTFSGNLGLASAAYNAGPGRVEAWLAGRSGLPDETRAYVRLVTGHTAEAWASHQPPQWQVSDIPQGIGCAEAAKMLTASLRPRPPVPARPAWLATPPSAEIAKLCRLRAIGAHPTQPAGSKQGHAQAQRDYFRDCVTKMQRDKKFKAAARPRR